MSNLRARTYVDPEYVHGTAADETAPMPVWADRNWKLALEMLDAAEAYQLQSSSINDVTHVVLNKVAEYSDIPERIRMRQVNSTLRDGVPPTVPPWHCEFTEDAILDDCDAFWSKIAEIMAWFLIATHNRVKGTWSEIYDTTLEWPPSVTFQIDPINPNLYHRDCLCYRKDVFDLCPRYFDEILQVL